MTDLLFTAMQLTVSSKHSADGLSLSINDSSKLFVKAQRQAIDGVLLDGFVRLKTNADSIQDHYCPVKVD